MHSDSTQGGEQLSCLCKFTCGSLLFDGKKKLRKQTGAGQKLISSPRLKTHLSRQCAVIEADSQCSPCKWRCDQTHGRGREDVAGDEDNNVSLCSITPVRITERQRAKGCLCLKTLIRSQGCVVSTGFKETHSFTLSLLFGKLPVMHIIISSLVYLLILYLSYIKGYLCYICAFFFIKRALFYLSAITESFLVDKNLLCL